MTDDQLAALFADAGVTGYLHAIDLQTGAELSHRSDEQVVLASVFKVPVLVELFRQGAGGELDLSEQVTIPVAGRAPGPFGLSVMSDPVTLSWRDLAWLMMGISDNAATDVICDKVDTTRVNRTMKQLGLDDTVLIGHCADLFATMFEDLGIEDPATADLENLQLTDPAIVDRLRVMDPPQTSHSTAAEIARLLRLIWTDQAGPGDACAQMRRILGLQVWPHRLASGFPEDDVHTNGKTGTLLRWRNEAGVVDYPDGRYAVAVFTRSEATTEKNPAADAVIGRAARCAVDGLRAS